MLANRADTYNLGDILGGRDDAFALLPRERAHLQPVLRPSRGRDPKDTHKLIRMAKGRGRGPTTELQYPYSAAEVRRSPRC
jgi:hypothetical protein